MTEPDPPKTPSAEPAAAPEDPNATPNAPYEPPKLTRLGTLLELTQSGRGPRTEAFRGSR
jgi:hypothetical protein